MKRLFLILFAALCLAVAGPLTPAPALAWHDGYESAVITVATDNQTSAAVSIPRGAEYVDIYVPTITSSTVSLLVSADGGTTYDDLFCFSNGTNTVLWSSAAGTGGMYLQCPCRISAYNKLKVYCGSGQASNRTFKLYFKKDASKSNQ